MRTDSGRTVRVDPTNRAWLRNPRRLRDLDGESLRASDTLRHAVYTVELTGPRGEDSGTVEIRGPSDEALVAEVAALVEPLLEQVAPAGNLATRAASVLVTGA